MSTTLLPQGFYDELYPDAAKRMNCIAVLLHHCMGQGYQLVDPPLVEFEDTLFVGSGLSLANETFRMMDPKSNRMMGIRADMTVQVARIAVSRLQNESRPLRLAYSGQVLKVQGDILSGQRQLWQAGFELVGADHATLDVEVVILAVKSLYELGIKNLCIDFTIPTLAPELLDQLGLEGQERKNGLQAMDKKDSAAIAHMLTPKQAKLLMPFLEMDISLKKLRAMKLPAKSKKICQRLREVIKIVQEELPEVGVSIDPLESLKFTYHSGIGFSIFAVGAKSELVRGGRYQIQAADANHPIEDAVGATFYINEILRVNS